MSRLPFVGGNWKMNTDLASAVELAEGVTAACTELTETVDIAVMPPFPYLQSVGRALGPHRILLGAQNLWHEPNGAVTGEVSAEMLVDLSVAVAIVGHSERRRLLRESNSLINRKLRAALDASLWAILCVGETSEEREAGRTHEVVVRQLLAGLRHVPSEQLRQLVVAYEPVWAIGTGRTASAQDAQEVHAVLRGALEDRYDRALSRSIRIIYGGSVNSRNAAELFAQPDIDGGLIGGASLKVDEFSAICRAAAHGGK